MATEKVALDIEVKGGESLDKATKSIREYKKEIAEAKALALNGDGEAAKRVGELQDKLEDLNDTTKSTKGDGIEPLTNSFALFKQGLGTGDMEKAKVGLKGIGSAMSAIPILLLVQGFAYLIENFKEIVGYGQELFNLFSDEEKAVKGLTRELENQKKTTATLVGELNREIAVMEAQGLSHDKILVKKKELIEAQIREAEVSIKLNFAKVKEALANDTITESIYAKQAATFRYLGATEKAEAFEKLVAISKAERIKKEVEDFNASVELVKNLRNQELVETIKVETEKRKSTKQTTEEKIIETKKVIDDDAKAEEYLTELDKLRAIDKANALISEKDQLAAHNAYLLNITAQRAEEEVAAEKKAAQEKKAIKDAEIQIGLDLTQRSLQAEQAISDAFFTIKLSKVKKGSAEEEALARSQFEINKKFQIALTTAQGIQNGITAFGAGLKAGTAIPIPGAALALASAYAGLSGIATLGAIAKISSTQFQSTSTGGSIGSNISSSTGSQITPPQNFNQPLNNPPTTTFTGNNNNNYQPIIKAVVVETENRDATNRINKLTNEASF